MLCVIEYEIHRKWICSFVRFDFRKTCPTMLMKTRPGTRHCGIEACWMERHRRYNAWFVFFVINRVNHIAILKHDILQIVIQNIFNAKPLENFAGGHYCQFPRGRSCDVASESYSHSRRLWLSRLHNAVRGCWDARAVHVTRSNSIFCLVGL